MLGEKSEGVSALQFNILGSYGVVFKANRMNENDIDQNGKKR